MEIDSDRGIMTQMDKSQVKLVPSKRELSEDLEPTACARGSRAKGSKLRTESKLLGPRPERQILGRTNPEVQHRVRGKNSDQKEPKGEMQWQSSDNESQTKHHAH